MKNLSIYLATGALVVAGTLTSTGAAQAATIVPPSSVSGVGALDPLTESQVLSSTTVGSVSAASIAGSSTLLPSFNRTLGLDVTTSIGLPASTGVPIGGTAGFFADNGTGATSVAALGYTFAPTDIFTGNTTGGIGLEVISADLGIELTVTATSASDTVSVPFTIPTAVSTPQFVVFNFSEFAGVDFTQLTALSISVTGPTASDASIRTFSVVVPSNVPGTPEPGTILGILAVAGAGALSRRGR
jgi:hypothetical protein